LKKPFCLLSILQIAFCFSQQDYEIDAQVDPVNDIIKVNQLFRYINEGSIPLDTLYLYDWNHSYSETSTPLAAKLAQEFNFQFEKSKSDKKGYTEIHGFRTSQDSLNWHRLEEQKDIVAIHLMNPIEPKDSIVFSASYVVKLPCNDFTGYGIDNNKEISFRNGFLQFVNQDFEGDWNLDSNYGFNDRTALRSPTKFTIYFPEDYTIIPSIKGDLHDGYWQAKDQIQGDLAFYLKKTSNFKSLGSSNFEIITDMANDFEADQTGLEITKRMQKFAEVFFGNLSNEYVLIDSEFYSQNPIIGIDLLLNTLRPIPKSEQFELKATQVLMRKLVQSKFPENFRQNRWLADGLSHYLFMRYVETYFPELRLIGNLAESPLLSAYQFAQAPFTAKTNLQAAFVYRRNLAQPLITQSQDLTKYNRKIALRSRSAMGIKILEKTEGKDQIDAFIFKLFTSKKKLNSQTIHDLFELSFEGRAKWFYKSYCTDNGLTDYEISQIGKSNNQVQVELTNHTKAQNPVRVNSYSKHQLVSSVWLPGGVEKQRLSFDQTQVDKIVLNPDQLVLEINTNNNNIRLNNSFSKRDKRFRLFEDIPSSHYAATYIAPNLTYNAYDGVLIGMVIHNGLTLRQPTTMFFSPQYGTKEKSLSGSLSIRHRSYFQKKKIANISYGFGVESFHFNTDQRYYRYNPQISATFRPEGLASNKRSIIGLELVSLHQEDQNKRLLKGAYNSSLSYAYSNSSSSSSRGFGATLQTGDSFTKFYASYRNRKYYREGKQYTFRFFIGLLSDLNKSGNFDFGISRVNDYSFTYNLLGRSETSGFFSQQYVLAEGGFKSFIPIKMANQLVMSANLGTTLWRGLEVYSDIGLVKNRGQKNLFIYDAGLSLNLIQDYLALYFPLYSNLGWEIDDKAYPSKIRFTLSIQTSQLLSLFTRSWF
jgi:hypothetical protein